MTKLYTLSEISKQGRHKLSTRVLRKEIERGNLVAFKPSDAPNSRFLVTQKALDDWICHRENVTMLDRRSANRLGPRLRLWRNAWYIFQPRISPDGEIGKEERVRCNSRGADTQERRDTLLQYCVRQYEAAVELEILYAIKKAEEEKE